MTEPAPLIVIRDGVPVHLTPRIAEMVIAVVESQAAIVEHQSGCVELHFGLSGVQGFLREKLGKWKVG